MPLVTIITPLYNASRFLKETFSSVLSQTLKDFEWIIIDDCSTDGSYELAKELIGDKVDFIHLYKLDQNSGTSTARNLGLDKAKGKYITFLDADDMIDPIYLELQVNFIKVHGPIITSSYRRLTSNTCTDFIVPKFTNCKTILNGNPLSCLSTMYEKEVFNDYRFPVDMKYHEDFYFWYMILKEGYAAVGNHRVLATYRIIKTSKNQGSKVKLVMPLMGFFCHKLKMNLIVGAYHTIKVCLYSHYKYRGVR